jgi:hypothetical protein
MATHDELFARIRSEFLELPALRLTFPQACRLWQVDRPTCRAALQCLVAERFLRRTSDGSYVVFAAAAARMPVPHAPSSKPPDSPPSHPAVHLSGPNRSMIRWKPAQKERSLSGWLLNSMN